MAENQLVGPYETGDWIPVRQILASRPSQWPGLDLTAQGHHPWAGVVPPLRCHLITGFRRAGRVRRKIDGPWQNEEVLSGDVCFLPRATSSDWEWDDCLENIHLHVSDHYLSRLAAEVFDRDDQQVALVDRLKVNDPVISSLLCILTDELQSAGRAEHLYVDAISTHLCVHVLRNYAGLKGAKPRLTGGLAVKHASRIAEYIEENLGQSLSIGELAAQINASPFHFSREFRTSFGQPPHQYVIARRLERARLMIAAGDRPLKQVAADCGFYDHAHMTRLFRDNLDTTPSELHRRITG